MVEPTLKRVAAGDQAAVREVLDRYGGLVWSLTRRFCPDRDAEDAVQDIFIDIWKSAPRYDAAVASEATFIAMIARRRLIDRRRAQARQPATEAFDDRALGAPDRLPSIPSDPVLNSEEARRAGEALTRLSPEQQRVLQLSIVYGLSHEKIARSTGLPLGTVKTHARRGLLRVRDLLDGRADRATEAVS